MALVGYWRLNGNSNDASGNGNNGTDTSVTYVDGIEKKCAYFNSYIDKIDIPHISSNYITLGFWHKNISINPGTTYSNFAHQDGYARSGTRGWAFYVYDPAPSGTNISIHWSVPNDTDIVEALFQITSTQLSAWNHIVGTFDGTNAIIYLNGIEKHRSPITGTLRQNTDSLRFGVRDDSRIESTGESPKGYTSTLFMDNAAWTPAKVKNEYSRVKGFY